MKTHSCQKHLLSDIVADTALILLIMLIASDYFFPLKTVLYIYPGHLR